MSEEIKDHSDSEEKKPIIIRNSTDLQRLKLEKLMKNPDKPVIIPERPKERGMPPVPDFVRNVMGSSAGAGSGEFHVYRHLRRKEYARQKYMKEKAEKERLEDEYHEKLEENKRIAEEKTAKKRLKRLKKKQNQKIKHKKAKTNREPSSGEQSEVNSSDEEFVKSDTELAKVDSECSSSKEGIIESERDENGDRESVDILNLENNESEAAVNKQNNKTFNKSGEV